MFHSILTSRSPGPMHRSKCKGLAKLAEVESLMLGFAVSIPEVKRSRACDVARKFTPNAACSRARCQKIHVQIFPTCSDLGQEYPKISE